jgi:hypothetical protein
MRALDRGDMIAAKAASERLDAGLWRAKQDAADASAGKKPEAAEKKDAAPMLPINPDAQQDPILKAFSVASLELRAGVLLAQNKMEAAKKIYTQAAAEEKTLGYHEPPFYIRPVAETEAAALLRAKDFAGAKTAYDAALVERPASGFELYGIARTKELSGDKGGARAEYQAFLKAWPSADASLPEVAHAKEAVGEKSVAAR